jgi:coenzyme F420 biosynthesis associated uncharacterized protein
LAEAVATVADLRSLAGTADAHVRDFTGLSPVGEPGPVTVVDRPDWVRSNIEGFRLLLDPLLDTLAEGRAANLGPVASAVGSRATGAELGALLAYLATRVLGQFELIGPAPDENGSGGRLTLVAPNIVAAERALGVDPRDFRLWVCLHEVTHRVQFTANPWLAGYMSSALGVITEEAGEDFGHVMGRLAGYVRERRDGTGADPNSNGIIGLLRVLQSEPQRQALDRLLVLGTLLEGHADHVMDAVGPAVVPTVATIRGRFDERRRRRPPPLQRLIRALLGFEAKIGQYTRGKAFVDEVVSRVGMERFNAIWSGPDTLPLPDEIDKPTRWIKRVL